MQRNEEQGKHDELATSAHEDFSRFNVVTSCMHTYKIGNDKKRKR